MISSLTAKEALTPFIVHCDMTANNRVGVTVVSHDSEVETRVLGFLCQGSYSRDVHYSGASLSQLASLINYKSDKCHGSVLLCNGSPAYGWWVSRDCSNMTYWGGASFADDYKCACGVTNSCIDTRFGWHCDKNDLVYREDSGLPSRKSTQVWRYRRWASKRSRIPHPGKAKVLWDG